MKIKKVAPKKKSDVHVTQSMFFEFRDELKELLKVSFHDLKSEIQEVRSEIHAVKAEVQEVRSEIHGTKSEIHDLKSEIYGVKSELHRIGLLGEEQNARNILVLDGYEQIYQSQKDLASCMGHLEKEWLEYKSL